MATFVNQAKSGLAFTGDINASDVITMNTPATLALATIVSASPIFYGGATQYGLVANTVYFVGTIVNQTFKLYKEVALTNVVDITSTVSAVPFTVVSSWSNQAES